MISVIISIATLILSIIINVCLVAFMLGKMTANQENIKTLMTANQENMKTLVEEYKNHSTEHFKRLEEKQDKHNNLIERMAVVEQSSKSAHKRSDQIEKHIEKIEEHLITWNE